MNIYLIPKRKSEYKINEPVIIIYKRYIIQKLKNNSSNCMKQNTIFPQVAHTTF